MGIEWQCRAYLNVQLITICAVVQSKCAVEKVICAVIKCAVVLSKCSL